MTLLLLSLLFYNDSQFSACYSTKNLHAFIWHVLSTFWSEQVELPPDQDNSPFIHCMYRWKKAAPYERSLGEFTVGSRLIFKSNSEPPTLQDKNVQCVLYLVLETHNACSVYGYICMPVMIARHKILVDLLTENPSTRIIMYDFFAVILECKILYVIF